jgi:5-hydroxyisourate hydrolase-like protein (transthyretin family)
MKTIKILLLLFLLLLISESVFAQTIYEVQPGTKDNEIKLTVANISEENPATNLNVVLTKKSSSLNFKKEAVTIEKIEAKAEAEASFTFDIERNAQINKKDTIEFMITDGSGTMMMKTFIFSYIGPKEFKLEQNYPNPFNPSTVISYQLPVISKVTLKVYDILGSEVKTLVNEEQEAGYKELQFNGSNFASGMYVYRLQAGEYVSTKKMMLLK